MASRKTSKKQKKSPNSTRKKVASLRVKKGTGVKAHDPVKVLLDEKRVSRAIWECLKHDDPEGLIEVIESYLEAVNLTRFAEEARVPRTTLYYTLRSKNPTVKTLSKLVAGCVGDPLPRRMHSR